MTDIKYCKIFVTLACQRVIQHSSVNTCNDLYVVHRLWGLRRVPARQHWGAVPAVLLLDSRYIDHQWSSWRYGPQMHAGGQTGLPDALPCSPQQLLIEI